MRSPHQAAFKTATSRLRRRLGQIQSDQSFWRNYHDLRAAAFEVEFLGKFYRRARHKDRATYDAIISLAKPLEDRLGSLDELDAMVEYCEQNPIQLANGQLAADYFSIARGKALLKFRHWMRHHGWSEGSAIAKLEALVASLHWLSGEKLRNYAREQLTDSLKQLQKNVDQGVYDPARARRGYRFEEVETRVHKLRRDIRKQAQYMAYTGGLFTLSDRQSKGRKVTSASNFYTSLRRSPFATDKFSKLPRARISPALPVPRVLFWALNRYVFELGQAKDWAFRLHRLREAGLKGEIDFNQLDVTLGSWRGCPTPFNTLVSDQLIEIRRTQLFAEMQKSIDEAR